MRSRPTLRSQSPAKERPLSPAPGIPPGRSLLAPALVLLAITLVYVTFHISQAADTYLALAAGAHFRAHGVTVSDPFSFASRRPIPLAAEPAPPPPGSWLHPVGWIDQNWLWQVGLSWVAEKLGLSALVLVRVAVYLLAAAGMLAAARLRGASLATGALVAAATLVVCRGYLEIRPADATNLGVVGLTLIIEAGMRQDRRWFWALVPCLGLWCNLHSGFVFAFIVMAVIGSVHLSLRLTSLRCLRLDSRTIMVAVAATAAGLLATVVLSPYRLANLTHILSVAGGSDAPMWRSISEWRPMWDLSVSLGGLPLSWSYLALLVLVLGWWAWRGARQAADPAVPPGDSKRLDVAGLAVVLVGVVMALTSRRMIPVAALVAAPVLAEAVDSVLGGPIRRLGARVSTRTWHAALALAWVGTAGVGLAVGTRAWEVFGRPFVADRDRTSLFDRLSHSFQRPWAACDFLLENRFAGRVWAFWEEAGFLNWRLISGRPTSQGIRTFIDGRAQQAFDVEALRRYDEILSGGILGRPGPAARPSSAPAAQLAAGVENGLRELGVAMVLIGDDRSQTSSLVAKSLFNSRAWRVVYVDEHATLLASQELPEGQEVERAVASGTATFPAPQAEHLTRAYRTLRSAEPGWEEAVLAAARAAYAAAPSDRAVRYAVQAGSGPAQVDAIAAFCREVTESFLAERQAIALQHGSYQRVVAARTAFVFLRDRAFEVGDGATHQWAKEHILACDAEISAMGRRLFWPP